MLDDELNVLPLSRKSRALGTATEGSGGEQEGATETKEEQELVELKGSVSGVQPVGSLVALAKTIDQVNKETAA